MLLFPENLNVVFEIILLSSVQFSSSTDQTDRGINFRHLSRRFSLVFNFSIVCIFLKIEILCKINGFRDIAHQKMLTEANFNLFKDSMHKQFLPHWTRLESTRLHPVNPHIEPHIILVETTS